MNRVPSLRNSAGILRRMVSHSRPPSCAPGPCVLSKLLDVLHGGRCTAGMSSWNWVERAGRTTMGRLGRMMETWCCAFREAAKLPPGRRQSGLAEKADRGGRLAKLTTGDASGSSYRIHVHVPRPSSLAPTQLATATAHSRQVCCHPRRSTHCRADSPPTRPATRSRALHVATTWTRSAGGSTGNALGC